MPNQNTPARPIIYVIGPSIAYVQLTQGLLACIDLDDAERVGTRNWCAMQLRPGRFYAGREECIDGKTTSLYLARFILGSNRGKCVDHRISERTLDNRRQNIRHASSQQNSWNSKPAAGRKFKGATWFAKTSKWRALIRVDGRLTSLGLYHTPEDAARAYDVAALKYFGEFARVNFPPAVQQQEAQPFLNLVEDF